ncbi:MAG: DNA mismatch repair endonuclease MutL [Dehalococcoidales bacterium]
MPIRVLDKKLVAQIAAGEVVERPASVVKELVENALDAGAGQIAVEVRGGGTSLIRILDNGAGIASDEVELAFERYATSKIGDLQDLQSIATLGFRGEALPSIAAVAQVDILTSAAGEATGTYISVQEGKVSVRKSQARPQGTTITVRELFRSVPARLKFLKSVSTENGHIANVVSQYALAYPEVSFTLFLEGRKTLGTAGKGRSIDGIIEVYGTEIARHMLEVPESGEAQVKVTGMIGSPSVSRSGRNYLSFFINRRWVSSRLLAWAVQEAYHGLLPQGKHPVAVLAISLPPSEVDVNIHPTKSEVKFQYERQVFTAVQKAVRQTLIAQTPVPRIEEVAVGYSNPSRQVEIDWSGAAVNRGVIGQAFEVAQPLTVALPVLRVLGQLMSSYIVAEGPDGLYLIDQHAAHERIVFEQVREQRSKGEIEVQGLLEPVPFEVTLLQETILKAHQQELVDFGFSLEPFGDRTYLARSVPQALSGGDWTGVLRELLDSGEGMDDWTEKVAISVACHSGAVRAGQSLSDEEMRALVRQLEKTVMPHTCPHGRPTLIHLSSSQLRREFGRG